MKLFLWIYYGYLKLLCASLGAGFAVMSLQSGISFVRACVAVLVLALAHLGLGKIRSWERAAHAALDMAYQGNQA